MFGDIREKFVRLQQVATLLNLDQDEGVEPSMPDAKSHHNGHKAGYPENGHKQKSPFLAPTPANEKVRLEALKLYQVDYGTDETLDNLVRLAATKST